MRYGHTSIVNFLSQLAMSLSGFIATVVLTRTLGREQYGTYVVILAVLSWVVIAGKLGLSQAIRKRVSEENDGNYVVSGAIAQLGLYILIAVALLLSSQFVNGFVGMAATGFLVVLLGIRLAADFVQTVLDGQHLVHVSSILSPVEWTSRSIVQVGLVLSGFGIVGALAGYIVGGIVATAIGALFISVRASLPSRKDFDSLWTYAQFSWLSSVNKRTFLSMDTVILAVFVTNSVIAVYEVAWNLASLFAIFGTSIRRTLFPEMSKISSEKGVSGEITGLLKTSLTYSGLFIIPGLLGSAIVGDVVLTIYGSGFKTGYYILLILTFARLLYGYQVQFRSTLGAIDRPDLSFRINAAFVGANLGLNVVLISLYGWYGAAAATTLSAGFGLGLSYYYASNILDVQIPVEEIGKQWFAAGIMAVAVFAGRTVLEATLFVVVPLIVAGAAIYFLLLALISREFRQTMEDNLPPMERILG